LVCADLAVYIRALAADVREVEYDPVEWRSVLDESGLRLVRGGQFCGVDAVEEGLLRVLDGLDVGGSVGVFFEDLGGAVVGRGQDCGAAVVEEEGGCEGEIAYMWWAVRFLQRLFDSFRLLGSLG